ncbi:peptidoglycan recognition protein 1 [Trichonephila clavata]|uniref:Peptidoglycan recognition protein 1 n=1 Tax=Trichonephila clavata TaxID=2740835 RepID=A0A8X6H0Q8_TRICU|nr:peptidoglycan recognition protein 1 [Trichonephila clavata]
MINSRPITYIYDDPSEPSPLTPAHFLIGKRLLSLPITRVSREDFTGSRPSLLKRYRHQQNLLNQFWNRWRKHYLLSLRSMNICPPSKVTCQFKVVDVVLIHDDLYPRNLWSMGKIIETYTGRDGCENMEIVSRAKWGARESKSNLTMVTPVPHIFLHHTAMRECNNFESCCQMMRTIQNFHMDDRGWDDIGYNFLIGGDGRVYMGRGWDRVGAHTYGFNRIAVAFSLMGDFSHKLPSELMLNATKSLIECAKNENHVISNYKLHGHRDAGCTECPGSAFYNLIKTWPHFEGGPIPGYKGN